MIIFLAILLTIGAIALLGLYFLCLIGSPICRVMP